MYIVIAGDGKVGSTLAEELSKEGHDIVVIDSNSKVVEESVDLYDIRGVCGNGASYQVQKEAGVDQADLLIAATSSDELNILCCLVAKKLGARHTIARVRNPDYSKQLAFFREELGLSMVVNPELEAAREIARILRFPSAIKIDFFAKGKVELAEVNIGEDSPLDGMPLYELQNRYRVKVLICAVQREQEVYIPDGGFVLKNGDKIHITASHAQLAAFLKGIGLFKERIRHVLIVGGGKIAFYLAYGLLDAGMHVTIVEQDEKRCVELSESLPKATVIQGDGTDPALLEEVGIGRTDACVSLTGIDEENILISMYAGQQKVDKVVTKINRTNFLQMLEKVGIESVVSPKKLTTDQIVRYVRAMQNSEGSSMTTLYRLVGNQVEAMEFLVLDSRFTGVPLRELRIRKNILIACIIRENRMLLPSGDDTIAIGDTIILVTANRALRTFEDIFV